MKELTEEMMIIKLYLDNVAKEDELFAEKYKNEKKSIEDCWKYITGEMYELAKANKKGRLAVEIISHETVFRLAKHYYEEEDIKIKDFESMAKASVKTDKPKEEKKEVKKEVKITPKTTKKEEEGKAIQLSLF